MNTGRGRLGRERSDSQRALAEGITFDTDGPKYIKKSGTAFCALTRCHGGLHARHHRSG